MQLSRLRLPATSTDAVCKGGLRATKGRWGEVCTRSFRKSGDDKWLIHHYYSSSSLGDLSTLNLATRVVSNSSETNSGAAALGQRYCCGGSWAGRWGSCCRCRWPTWHPNFRVPAAGPSWQTDVRCTTRSFFGWWRWWPILWFGSRCFHPRLIFIFRMWCCGVWLCRAEWGDVYENGEDLWAGFIGDAVGEEFLGFLL